MAGGWGHALASGVNGYLRGMSIVRDTDEAEKDRQWKEERRARQRKQESEEDALKADLKTAARQVDVEEGAGGMVKPPEMDNRDVGLPENANLPNQGLQQGGYQVAGQAYADRAAADAAAQKQNAPEAINARVAGAYRSAGQFDKALAIESADRQSELQKMQLADQRWKRDLGAAMRGGHEGLAQLATTSEAGPMKGLKVQAIPSADGKTVTYGAIDADGKVAPIPGLPQFSNDQNGLIQAAWMLDRTIEPSARMAHFTQQEERERQQKNSDRTFEAGERHFSENLALAKRSADRADATGQRQDRLADTQIRTAEIALRDAERSAKIPPAVKMQVEGLRKEADTINTAVIKAQADGTWDTNNPNAKALLERQAVVNAKINKALTPYIERDAGTSDPFGLKKPQGTNAGGNGGQGGGAGRGSVPRSYKDPVWDAVEEDASRKTGVPTEVLKTIRTVGERSNSDQVSPKGAKTVYQFIPSSRDKFLKKYGVDAYSSDPAEQALAAAYHLKESYDRTGSWEKAMAGYNGGTSGEKGTNKTAENRDYAARTAAALAAADPMAAVYKKQVNELNKGLRVELSPDVAAWKQRKDQGDQRAGEQRFNAAQQAYLQEEKLRAQKKDKELASAARAS